MYKTCGLHQQTLGFNFHERTNTPKIKGQCPKLRSLLAKEIDRHVGTSPCPQRCTTLVDMGPALEP